VRNMTCTAEKVYEFLVTNSEGRPVSWRTFDIKIFLKNLVGEGVVWISIVLDKDWRTAVNTEIHFGFC